MEGDCDETIIFKANRQVRNNDYDIVIGPIANDDVRTQFVKHMLGEITEIELMENLKWSKHSN